MWFRRGAGAGLGCRAGCIGEGAWLASPALGIRNSNREPEGYSYVNLALQKNIGTRRRAFSPTRPRRRNFRQTFARVARQVSDGSSYGGPAGSQLGRVIGLSGHAHVVDLGALRGEQLGQHPRLELGLLRAPPQHLATVAEHQGDLVDGLHLDVVHAGGEVAGEHRDDARGLGQGVGAGGRGGPHPGHPLGRGPVVAEDHALGVEPAQPAAELDDRDGGALGDVDPDAVGPGAGHVDVLDLRQGRHPARDGLEVDQGELLPHRDLGDREDAVRAEQAVAVDLDLADGEHRREEHQPDRRGEERHHREHGDDDPPVHPASRPLPAREALADALLAPLLLRGTGAGRASHGLPATGRGPGVRAG